MATETVERGLSCCRCPACAAEDSLSVRVSDGLIVCSDCDGEMTAEGVERLARSWLKLAAWAKAVPCGVFGEES